MAFVVMGAGALGSFIGGLTAAAGEQVIFVDRGPRLRALQRNGLLLRVPAGDLTMSVRATANPRQISSPELVLFCVRSYDTQEAARAVLPIVGPDTPILCLQGGVENEERIEAVVGQGHVISGVAYAVTVIEWPGRVEQRSRSFRVVLDQKEAQATSLSHLRAVLLKGPVQVDVCPDIRVEKWRSLILTASLGGVTAVSGVPVGDVLADTRASEMLETAVDEAYRVGSASGIPLPADTPDLLMGQLSRLPFDAKSGMQLDLERGRRLELDALNGAVVRIGQSVGVDTPVHRSLYAALRLRDSAARS